VFTLHLDVGFLHDVSPLGGFLREEGRELCGRAAARLGAERGELLDRGGLLQRRADRGAELVDHGGRRVLRREYAVEGDAVDVRQARLDDSRDIGDRGCALRPQHREPAQPPCLDVLERVDELLEAGVDMAGDQVGDRRGVAAIAHLGPGHAGAELQQLAHEMIDADAARHSDCELAWIALSVCDELRHGLHRQGRAHQQHVGRDRKRAHRRERLLPAVGRLRHRHRPEHDRAVRADEQRVAVRRGSRHIVAGDGAARAGAVLHHDRLAEHIAERRLQHAR
jgi:hypothetical protein